MNRVRILIVEDDAAIRAGIAEKLLLEGYDPQTAADGEQALARLAREAPDLVILDLMLPRLDGYSVLRRLRRDHPELPVLILSARGSEDEKVEGLRAGADDYLAKPFGLRELLARVEALLRRARGAQAPFAFGDVVVDPRARRVTRGGDEVLLSRKELEVLLFLVEHHDRVVSRDEILASVWGHLAASDERAVDFHILNLRRKLEPDPRNPVHIVTRHGLGYQLIVQ